MEIQDNYSKQMGVVMMKIKLKNPNEFKKMLILAGLSQTDLAKEIEVAPPYISQIVNEERYPSAKIAKKIVFKLGLKFGDIFFIDDACKSYQENIDN
jgi:DNA-binding XRE family transcriptional regulator